MPLDKRNSIMAEALGLIFSLFDVALARQVTFSIPHYMDLPVFSFVSHSSLLTAKTVDLAVAHDGFPS